MNKTRLTISVILACIIFLSGCKKEPAIISLGNIADEKSEIEGFPENGCGYIIYDVEQQKTVKSHNALKEFIPASVTKLFTALFARKVLGAEYTFITSLSYNGNIEPGRLKGDLYLKGSGDPELSMEGILYLVEKLKSFNIREITGNFFYDDTLFPSREIIDKNMPSESYYNAGVSPLSFNSNTIYAVRRKDKEGKLVSSDLLPQLPSFTSSLYEETPDYPLFKYKQTGGRELWALPKKKYWDNKQPLPIKNPGLYTAEIFRKLCGVQGIKLSQPGRIKATVNYKPLAEYTGRPLDPIIKNLLSTSNNVTAELLYITSSNSYSGKTQSPDSGKNHIENFFSVFFPRIKWNSFKIVNASGLTSLNRITPEQTAAVLLYMEKQNDETFKPEKILPLSGWDGTMKNRLDNPETAFRVYAKTGAVYYATSLAGVFYAKSGKKYIFSVYINDLTKRSEHDRKDEKTMSDANDAAAWTKKGSTAIDRFIFRMIEEL
jgi:D-alanyl-D-alanine carboxypeptidase/D-alanyl-D-alanine-endopeptidase (penicillin-binding protein 4)